MDHLNSYIYIVLSSFITLFPVVNPIGTAFVLNPFFSGLSKSEQRSIAKKVAGYSFFICLFTLLVGQYILAIFGLSIPVVQFAGGIVICKIGWEFMSDSYEKSDVELKGSNPMSSIMKKVFYPITFPTTTGAGTIAVLLALAAHNRSTTYLKSMINISAILISVVAICIIIFIFYSNTTRMLSYIGEAQKNIVNKISAFLVFCVGLDIATSGLFSLIKEFMK